MTYDGTPESYSALVTWVEQYGYQILGGAGDALTLRHKDRLMEPMQVILVGGQVELQETEWGYCINAL